MANDIIDINVYETVETVAITINPNLTTVNINKVTSSGGGGSTNLSTTQTASNFTINSDTGDDALVPLGNGTLAGATLNDYTTAEKNKLVDTYTKGEVDTKITGVYKIKGSVANYAALPSSGQVIGDVWNLLDTGGNYVWTGTVWDELGTTVDISGKANINSPTFTGIPLAPTAADGTNNTQIATTAFTKTAIPWTKTGNDIKNNNTGGVVKVQGGTGLYYDNALQTVQSNGTVGFSVQNGGNFYYQYGYGSYSSANTFGNASGSVQMSTTSGNAFISNVRIKYLTNLSLSYDDRTLVDKGYVNNTFVPYTGATTDVDLGLNDITAEKLIKSGGTSSQILAADGSVITAGNNITITGGQISSVGGTGDGGSSVNYYLNGGTSQGTFGGTTYYEFSKTAVIGTEADFNINTNGYIASFITDVADPSLLLIPAGNWNLEFFFSSSSAGGSPSFYVELYKYDGTTFTSIASSSTNPEGITGGTAIDAYFTPLAVPETVLTVNDRLAIRVFVNASSKTITLHTQNGHLCEVITTFTAGLTALNGLQAQVQNFATGTTGTDFAINSSGSTHTFNLPSASATARGVVTTGSQTFAGDKTFTGAIGASNLSGTNTGDNATNTQYSGLATSKQDTLQSTVNIKSINGNSVLGSGDLTISAEPQAILPFRMLANNSAVTAIPTVQFFKDIGEQTYSLSPTFTPITAPTTIIASTYKYEQVGSLVTVRLNLIYTTPASITQVVIPLPADMPTPLSPTGLSGALDVLYYGVGMFNTLTTSVATVGRNCFLRRNATTGFEFVIVHSTSVSTRVISLTLQYFTE